MKNNNNLQKLSWLQSEIDNTINEAVNFLATKKAGFDLSSVAEKQMDLSVFANYIHQIVGSLQMVEIDSIALFSQEIEWSADRLAQKQAFVLDDFGRLQEQAQQISDSIHRMLDGLPELSIEQFESMNLLRRERGEKPCGIELFFDPNLDVDFEMDEQQAVNHDDYRVLVGAHQEDYRESLLLWLKSGDPVAIQSIRSTFSKLHSLARFGAAVRLWWIAYAFVDTVRLNKHVNKRRQTAIFAKLNEIMAFIASKGESVLIRDGAVSVIRHMLFAIVTSEERSETMKDVVKRFNLQQYTQAASAKTAVDEMAVISANLRRLRDYIDGKIDLSKVQKVMTDFFNRDQSNSVHLDWVSSQMHSLAEACASHDQPQLERLANELSEISIKLESDNEMFKNEFTSLNAATAVMLLEHSLTDDVVPDESWEKKVHTKIAQLRMMQGKPVNEDDLLEGEGTAADNSQLHALIAGEIDEHLRYTEVALTQFSEDMTRLNILDGIPERMKQVRGALQMLGHQKIALLARMGEEKFTEVIRGKRSPTLQVLEALAVTVSALMQGTQDLKEGFVRHDDLIERSLKDIGLAFGGGVSRKDVERLIATSSEYLNDWVLDNTNYNALEQLRLNLRDIAALSKKTGLLQVVSLVEEQNRLLDIVSEDPEFISTEVKATLTHSTAKVAEYLIDLYGTEETDEEREFDQKIAAKAAAITSSDEDPDAIRYHDDMSVDELPLVPKRVQEEEMPLEATQQAKEKAVEVDDEDSIDPEMLDIYIEESEELLTAAQLFYKKCLNDPGDRESLGELRRQFHTLKGSGRMVGLDKVGELSWLVESLLNYVLDTGETLNRDMLHFVDDATSTLQALLAGSYADQEKLDVVSWGDRADQLTAIVEQEESPVASKEATLKHSLLKDPELRQVFVQETHVNLLKIKPIAEALLLKPSLCPVELYIAVHTLKGNMRGLLLDEIAVAYDKVEQVLTLVREKNQPVGREVAVALRDLQVETEQFLHQAEQQNYAMSVESKVWPDVAQRMQDLLESLEAQVEETQVEEAQVEEAQVEEAQVEEAQVEEAQVEEAQVEEAQVEEAQVEEAQVEEAQVEEAQVEEAQVEEAQVEEAQVEEAQVEETQVEEAQVEEAQVEEAQVEEAQVEEAQVEEAQVEEAQVEEAQVEEAQVEEAQVEEAQVEETQVEEALGFETTIDETSIDETSIDETSIDETSIDETSIDETSIDETSIDETSIDETSIDETSIDETSIDETPIDETSIDETSIDETSIDETSIDETSIDETSIDETSIDETSIDEVDVEVTETPAQRQARRLHDVIPLDIAGMVAESQAPGHVSSNLYSEAADHDDGLSDTEQIFIEEAQDLLVIVDGVANVGSIDELESQQGELLRVLHTLKGSARVAEFLEIGELTHVLEDVIEHFSAKNSSALTLLTGVIGEYHDSIYDAITQHPQDHDAHKNNELLATMQQLLASQDDAELSNESIDNIADDSAVELNESSEPYALGNVSSQEMDELKKQVEALGEIGGELDQPLLQAIDDVYLHLDSVMQVAKSIKYKKNWHNKQLLILRDISSVQSLIERQPVLSPLHNLADVFHEYITKASANNAAVRKRLVSHIQQVQVCFDASLQAAKESKEVSGQHDVVLKLRRELERFLEASPVDPVLEEKVELIKDSEVSEVETVEAVEEPQQNIEAESAVEQKEEQPTQPQGDKEPETPAAAKSAPVAAEQPSISSLKQRVRVPGHTLDNLANFAGDVNVTRSQMSEDLDVMKGTLDRLRENIRESSGLLRDLEIQADSGIETMRQTKTEDKYNDFDPLEMDRYNQVTQLSQNLMESLDRLTAIESELNAYVHRTETSLQQQTLTSKELMQQVLQIRLVPFSDITAQVRQTVRQTSKHLDKQVDFVIVGGDVRLDKTVLNVMLPAVDHMLRNAIDHGIESVRERKELGKPAVAMITITCEQQGKDVEVSVADDGRGLDVEKINAMAVERSLLDEGADEPDDADLNDEILLNLIAASGFTTSTQVTQISGRGIGMDVVRETLRRLGGNIQLQNRPGHGVKLTLRAPISTAVTRVMFIQAAGKEYGVPMRMVDRMVELTVEDFQQLMQVPKPLFKDQGESFHIIDLAAHLGLESKRDKSESVTVMLVYAGGHNIAVVVDEVLHSREMVVKSFGSHLSSLLAYAGAAVRADGRLTFIIDFVGLSYLEAPLEVQSDEDELEADSRLKVMVVDDSLTVRKASQNDLMKSGIDVVLASNGLDAQEQLQQGVRADLMLLDLEMPKMDGFELLQWIREQSAVPKLPVIIISSRSIDKYMDRVMQLGANDFIGKPYQLKQLLEKINQQTQNADNVEGQS